MDAVDTEWAEDRTRILGLVLMFLLSAILSVVLLRTRPQEAQEAPRAQSRSDPGEGLQPGPQAPSSPSSGPGDYYRGWPLFEGWPLPQLPAGSGGGAPQEPEQRPSP